MFGCSGVCSGGDVAGCLSDDWFCFSGSVFSARTSSAWVASGAGGRGAGASLASRCGVGRSCDCCCCCGRGCGGGAPVTELGRWPVTGSQNRTNAGSSTCLGTGALHPASPPRPPSLPAAVRGRRLRRQRTSPRSEPQPPMTKRQAHGIYRYPTRRTSSIYHPRRLVSAFFCCFSSTCENVVRAITLQAIRASLLARAIARTLRCSRFLAASIRGLSPCRSQRVI